MCNPRKKRKKKRKKEKEKEGHTVPKSIYELISTLMESYLIA